jgi:predicted O-linked N-acetylglucosamine transferase (SPINDLY family)
MSLALPHPEQPAQGATASRAMRAWRRWQHGQEQAGRDNWPAAALAFEEAFRLQSDSAHALAAAHAFIKAGRSDLALPRARALRAAQPQLTLAYTLESHALLQLGRAEEAVRGLRELPAGATRDHAFLTSLAVALQHCRRDQEAVTAFMELLSVKIDDPLAHFRLGMSFKDLGMKAQAAECVRTALTLGLAESQLAARGQLVFLEREACNWAAADHEMATLRRELAAVPAGQALQAGAFTQAVLSDDPAEVLKVARLYALHMARGLGPVPRCPAKPHAGRLRIGYLSSDFHQHATSQLMVQMLECHDRSAFEVTLLSTGPDDASPMRTRIAAACERFEDLRGAGDGAIARRIRDLGIHILVDLKGATNDNRMTVLAYRPAPLQVNWLGFPGTSGAPYIDYVIGDPVVTPLAHAAHFSEAIAQLPHCYQPNDAQRARPRRSSRAEWGAPQDKLLLCAFHQSYKISADVFDRWCELLHALPDAVLWLLAWNVNVQGALTAAAAARGIGAERLLFAPTLPLADHLSRLVHADLYLDAWPCNAHTTAGEALWVGVPVVTQIGATFAQRVAASLLHAVELDELVCSDTAAYQACVLALARDPLRRAALRARLQAQHASSLLFDGRSFARDIEALYRRMWERAVAGLAPAPLPAQPTVPASAAS